MQVFCDRIAARRGRPLHLHSVPGITGADALCGVWIATETSDHVFHEAATSPLHRDHIVLHEISHMLLGHSSIIDGAGAGNAQLFPDIDPATVTSLLNRVSYTNSDEQAAERLAGLIAAKIENAAAKKDGPGRDLQRIDDALSDS